ncbi:MAG TPA: cytochrome c biogenesis protein CcdA, partial [Nitrospirales bacterium]
MFPQAPDISLFIAFAAGLLSFVSPCVLPLVPSYVTYITGLTLEELTSETERARVRGVIIVNSLLFIAGFSAVFIAFGASASLVGQLLMTYQEFIRKLGGVLIVVFGLYVMGVLKIKFLMSEMRVHLQRRPVGYVGSFLVGVAF